METINSYTLIIAGSLIIIISYFFNILSRRTSIPSVLMLISIGIILKIVLEAFGYINLNFFTALELLGVIGLILIVLEASLDLELTREKWPIIRKSFSVAFISLVVSAILIALIFQYTLNTEFSKALLYAIPVSILSSAIIIPSVENLRKDKKEFLIYEGAFSDILGIMFFYYLLRSFEKSSGSSFALYVSISILLTIIISVISSFVLVILFQRLKNQTRLFLLMAALLLLYSLGKMVHLSSLLIIITFGLVLHNRQLFFTGVLKERMNNDDADKVYTDFKLITFESSFAVRSFFFVVFGLSITLSSLVSLKVIGISASVLGVLFLFRIAIVKLFIGNDIFPQIFIAPRGLITVLLFYSIPSKHLIPQFKPGILLFIILGSCILMTWALIMSKRKDSIRKKMKLATDNVKENKKESKKDEIKITMLSSPVNGKESSSDFIPNNKENQ